MKIHFVRLCRVWFSTRVGQTMVQVGPNVFGLGLRHLTVTKIVRRSSSWCRYNEFIGKVFLISDIEIPIISEFDMISIIPVPPIVWKQSQMICWVSKTFEDHQNTIDFSVNIVKNLTLTHSTPSFSVLSEKERSLSQDKGLVYVYKYCIKWLNYPWIDNGHH